MTLAVVFIALSAILFIAILTKNVISFKINLMNATLSTGYSGTPLAKKLGFKASSRVLVLDAPTNYADLVDPLPEGLVFVKSVNQTVDTAHVFVTQRDELARLLSVLREKLNHDAAIWISWPKKTSKVPTTITEDTIRELALPLGFVDIKVCAVSPIWSGLKLVVRKELR